jgi:iron transport multicopper oxidase
MNGTTYIPPVVPTLYTALSAPQNISTDPAIYGPNTNVVVFNNTVGIVEIIINNFDSGAHPFHIHGHVAQIVAQGLAGTKAIQQVDNGTRTTFPPANRDVFMVEKYSYTVIRFKSGNPGIWMLHCHIEWHIEAGLVMTLVEDPIQLQQQNLTIPTNMLAACAAQGIPTVGNAGGNSVNWYDMKNAPIHPNKSPWG